MKRSEIVKEFKEAGCGVKEAEDNADLFAEWLNWKPQVSPGETLKRIIDERKRLY